MASASEAMTIEAFTAYSATRRTHGRCEVVRGMVRDMPFNDMLHGSVTANLTCLVGAFIHDQKLGTALAGGTGFAFDENGKSSVRSPDFAYIVAERDISSADHFCPIAPDLVVETLSPSDTASAVAEKVQWWLDRGVKLVWIVDPQEKIIDVRHGDTIHRLRIGDTLTGGDVLPGFTCALAEVFT